MELRSFVVVVAGSVVLWLWKGSTDSKGIPACTYRHFNLPTAAMRWK